MRLVLLQRSGEWGPASTLVMLLEAVPGGARFLPGLLNNPCASALPSSVPQLPPGTARDLLLSRRDFQFLFPLLPFGYLNHLAYPQRDFSTGA